MHTTSYSHAYPFRLKNRGAQSNRNANKISSLTLSHVLYIRRSKINISQASIGAQITKCQLTHIHREIVSPPPPGCGMDFSQP
jgi:hypothetical protein